MSQETIAARAAQVRSAWSLRERIDRARESERRCQYLLKQITKRPSQRAAKWAV